MTYDEWIKANAPENPRGLCKEICKRMKGVFPELRLVRGHFDDPIWGKRGHWWLLEPAGTVVDPTVSQFPGGGLGEYLPWIEGAQEPTGKCMHCGELCYDHARTCSENCSKKLIASLEATRLGITP